MIKPTLNNLRVQIGQYPYAPGKICQELTIYMGNVYPVISALVFHDGDFTAWRTVWGIEGNTIGGQVTKDELAELMGWSK